MNLLINEDWRKSNICLYYLKMISTRYTAQKQLNSNSEKISILNHTFKLQLYQTQNTMKSSMTKTPHTGMIISNARFHLTIQKQIKNR